jgi:hypothetical protein
MKVMSSSKEPAAETQQSYFYVVWPEAEDKSSSVASSSSAASEVVNSITSTGLPTLSYGTPAMSTSNTNDTATSSSVKSPASSPHTSPELTKEEMASVQVVASNPTQSRCTANLGSDGGNGTLSSSQHLAAAVPCNQAGFSSLDAFSTSSSYSLQRQKTMVSPDYSPASKPRFHRGAAGCSTGEQANMREIGTVLLVCKLA